MLAAITHRCAQRRTHAELGDREGHEGREGVERTHTSTPSTSISESDGARASSHTARPLLPIANVPGRSTSFPAHPLDSGLQPQEPSGDAHNPYGVLRAHVH